MHFRTRTFDQLNRLCLVLVQHVELDPYWASSQKWQPTGRYVTCLGHIILTLSQLVISNTAGSGKKQWQLILESVGDQNLWPSWLEASTLYWDHQGNLFYWIYDKFVWIVPPFHNSHSICITFLYLHSSCDPPHHYPLSQSYLHILCCCWQFLLSVKYFIYF